MASSIHQSICETVGNAIGAWRTSLPRDQRRDILPEFGTDRRATTGQWTGSKKIPDFGLKLLSNGEAKMKWVLEVGFSRDYNSLKENARLWLEGLPEEVDMVALVHFQEHPPYKCPLFKDQDPSTQGILLDIRAIHAKDINCHGSLGPAIYKGMTWVNPIVRISMETWARDGDGKAKQKGLAKDLLHEATMEIPVKNFLPSLYHNYGNIVVDLDDFRYYLPISIRAQASERCQAAVGLWNKQEDDKKDRDYEEQQAEDEDEDEGKDEDGGPGSRTRSKTGRGRG